MKPGYLSTQPTAARLAWRNRLLRNTSGLSRVPKSAFPKRALVPPHAARGGCVAGIAPLPFYHHKGLPWLAADACPSCRWRRSTTRSASWASEATTLWPTSKALASRVGRARHGIRRLATLVTFATLASLASLMARSTAWRRTPPVPRSARWSCRYTQCRGRAPRVLNTGASVNNKIHGLEQ